MVENIIKVGEIAFSGRIISLLSRNTFESEVETYKDLDCRFYEDCLNQVCRFDSSIKGFSCQDCLRFRKD